MKRLPLTLTLAVCLSTVAAGAEDSSSVQPVRVADAVCAKCHTSLFRNFLKTPMANASGLAADNPITGEFRHAQSGVSYRISQRNGALWLDYSRHVGEPLEGRRRLDYFLGSGHLGLTYLSDVNGYLLESPVAFYAGSNTYDMKPGLANVETMPPALPMTTGCMRCHMSGVQEEDRGTANHFQNLPFRYGGITCESCHGDIRAHVASLGKSPVINPVKLDPERRDSLCVSCHLEGDTRIEHAGRNVNGFKPGDRIADYLSYFVFSSDRLTSRGVSEIEQLSFSTCKRVSGNSMSCMSCHDPHYTPPPLEKAAFYRSKCLACHNKPEFATNHFAHNPDCTACHMPKTAAENVPHIAWTDHRIRRTPDPVEQKSSGRQSGQLVSFLDENVNGRDLALGYYDLVLSGNTQFAETAFRQLSAVYKQPHPDLPVLTSLAYLTQMKGDVSEAMKLYREALAIDPVNVNASNNLAILLARSGQLAAAEALWKATFARNEALDHPGVNLALAECMLGKKDEAINTLQKVLFYSPDQKIARQTLAAVRSGAKSCSSEAK